MTASPARKEGSCVADDALESGSARDLGGRCRHTSWEVVSNMWMTIERVGCGLLLSGSVLFVALTVPMASAGCAADEDCIAGKQCSCSDCSKTCGGDDGKSCQFTCTGGDCSFVCPGGGCQVTAQGAARVTLDCAGGGCNLTSSNTKSSSLSCKGNGCQHTCTGATSCQTTECTSTCQLQCNGASTCSQSCDVGSRCSSDGSGLGASSGASGAGSGAGGFDLGDLPNGG